MLDFDHWATPVTSKRWVIACSALSWVYFHGLPLNRLGRWKHRAWERACGIAAL